MLLPKEPTEGLNELLRGGPTLSTYSDFREWFDSRKHGFGKRRFWKELPDPECRLLVGQHFGSPDLTMKGTCRSQGRRTPLSRRRRTIEDRRSQGSAKCVQAMLRRAHMSKRSRHRYSTLGCLSPNDFEAKVGLA
jgi:hypothetical protein